MSVHRGHDSVSLDVAFGKFSNFKEWILDFVVWNVLIEQVLHIRRLLHRKHLLVPLKLLLLHQLSLASLQSFGLFRRKRGIQGEIIEARCHVEVPGLRSALFRLLERKTFSTDHGKQTAARRLL